MSPGSAAALQAMTQTGRLSVAAGQITSVSVERHNRAGSFIVTLRSRKGTEVLRVGALVDCSGPGSNPLQSPLLARLHDRGIVRRHGSGVGIDTDSVGIPVSRHPLVRLPGLLHGVVPSRCRLRVDSHTGAAQAGRGDRLDHRSRIAASNNGVAGCAARPRPRPGNLGEGGDGMTGLDVAVTTGVRDGPLPRRRRPTTSQLLTVARRLGRSTQIEGFGLTETERSWKLLTQDDEYEAWIISWPPGGSTRTPTTTVAPVAPWPSSVAF